VLLSFSTSYMDQDALARNEGTTVMADALERLPVGNLDRRPQPDGSPPAG
jgi:hypothetical protein